LSGCISICYRSGLYTTVMSIPIQVLILEDREADVKLVLHELRRAGLPVIWSRCATRADFLANLDPPPDVILSDYSMPQFDARAALELLQERGLDVPLIVISGTIGEDTAVEIMKHGASDYLLKDRLGRLGPAIRQALEQRQLREERRLALERLSESEKRFVTFMDHLPGAAFLKDAAGRHLYVNATFEKMLGKDRSGWLGRTNEQLFAAATAFQLSHNDRLVLQTQRPLQTIETIEHDDALRHYLVVKFPVAADGNGGTLVAGIGVEVTDRIRAEESLREQMRLARLSADVGLALTRHSPLKDMLRVCADALLRNLGAVAVRIWTCAPGAATLELAASAGLAPRGAEESVPFGATGIGLAAQSRQGLFSNDVLHDARLQNGTWFKRESLVSLASVPLLVDERLVGVFAVYARKPLSQASHDVLQVVANQMAVGIERKQSEDALRASEERYRRIIETTAEGVWTFDAQGRTTYVNDNMARMMGQTVADMLGQPLTTLLMEEDRPRAEAQLERLRQGIAEQFDFKVHRGDKKTLWLMIAATPIFDTAGRYAGALLMCSDVTERKRLEEQYRQAQKMEAIGRLAGGVAHDFNNLITIITGCGDLALGKLSAEHPGRELIREIMGAGDRAAALTRQLLAFSRQQVLEPRVLDLNLVIADVEKLLRRMIGEDIELNTVLDAELGHVKADPGQLQQILMNLAVNARDAMPQGGKLTLETCNVVLDDNYTRLHPEAQPGRYVMLAVSDTGIGMDSSIRVRVFEPFFTTKDPGKGTGLGLATVYGIVKQSGGAINLYSEVGHGTTFKIYLPRVDEPLSPAASVAAPARPPRGTETVLLVEDDDSVRLLSRHILQLFGYRVLEAGNVDEAITAAQSHEGPIHLLLTDVVMPGGGGRHVAEVVTELKPGIKVLYASGYTDDAVVRYGILRAEAAFLQKPFTAASLASKVREVLDS
jgi:two-component system cell cycle sensor histidine kinase/response regulator CckA